MVLVIFCKIMNESSEIVGGGAVVNVTKTLLVTVNTVQCFTVIG